ncbi:MAG: tetratricopeptide repeat protein, partial [Chloroflexota bacterium]
GILLAYLGRYEEAIQADGQTLDIYREVGYAYGMARMYNNRGYSIGKILPTDPQVEAHYREAYALFDKFEDAYMRGITLVHLGEAAEALGRYDEAIDWLIQAVEIFRKTKHMRWFVISLTALGYSQILIGDYGGAATHLDEALEVGQQFQLVNDSKRVLASAAALFSKRNKEELAAVTAYHLLNDSTVYAEVSSLCETLISEISREPDPLDLKKAQTRGESISFGALQTLVGSELSAANV